MAGARRGARLRVEEVQRRWDATLFGGLGSQCTRSLKRHHVFSGNFKWKYTDHMDDSPDGMGYHQAESPQLHNPTTVRVPGFHGSIPVSRGVMPPGAEIEPFASLQW